MMILRRLRIPLIMMFASICLVGCNSAKNSVKNNNSSANSGNISVTASQAPSYLKSIISAELPWEKLRIPVTASVESPAQVSMSGIAVMERGKSINISLRVFGMEVAVLYLTNDSVTVLDKWNKRYLNEDLRGFLGNFPVNIDNVQDLLLGRPFLLGQSRLTSMDLDKFHYEATDNGMWACQPTQSNGVAEYAFIFLGETLHSIMAGVAGKQPVELKYENPVSTTFGPMSGIVSFNAQASKKTIAGSLIWDFEKSRWNSSVEVKPVSIPKGYSRIYGADILRGLKL